MSDLEPPRKSVELQDPGAHELGQSEPFLRVPRKSSHRRRALIFPEHCLSELCAARTLKSRLRLSSSMRWLFPRSLACFTLPSKSFSRRARICVVHQLTARIESSEGEDHFSDASEGRDSAIDRSSAASPVPVTRVEKVDDEPSYGEVPGTPAYKMRMQDAVPDEVEIVPEGTRSRSTSRLSASDRPSTPLSPGGTPIPRTVVERIDDKPSHGEIPGTEAYEHHRADAVPDVVLKVPEPPKG